jgi:hypothetical protein
MSLYKPFTTQYGRCAVRAYELMQGGLDPEVAWDKAAYEIIPTKSSRIKSCPKCFFLGLFGIKKGRKFNTEYAIKALNILKNRDINLDEVTAKEFWDNELQLSDKTYNEQVHILFDLKAKGYL